MEQRKDIMTGIIRILILFIVGSIFLAIAGYILSFVIDIIGRIIVFVLQWAVFGGIAWYGYKYFKKPKPKEKPAEVIPEEAIRLYTSSGQPIVIGNPFRGIFVLGAAGSGKSESIAVPLLSEFIRNGFSGLVYDFKFPTLGQDVQSFISANGNEIKHHYIDLNNPEQSPRVNPIQPDYLLNTSYAREFAQAIVANLIKESIKKPDFWNRSATDLLTACIWYLKEEYPAMCDIPHVCALVSSKDEDLLRLLQKNPQTAQMTMSIFSAMERGADGQVSGVVGTLQSAIAQINTPELMYIFGGNDFSLDLNNPSSPAIEYIDAAISLLTFLKEVVCSLSRIGIVHFHFPFVLLISPPTSNNNNWLSEHFIPISRSSLWVCGVRKLYIISQLLSVRT